MIPVSSAFKEAMKRPVKELDAYIRIDANNSITSADDLISIKISCDSGMCKAAMRKLEAKYTGEHNLLGQWVHAGFGVRLPSTGTFDYLDYGSFLITEIKTSKDTDVTEIVAYDKMINAMTKYEELQTIYPQGLFAYTQLLCQACNLTLGNVNLPIHNDWQVTEELWKNISGVTYRDIFQQIAQVTGTTCIIQNDDKIYFKTINATGETLTYDNLFKLRLEPIYGEINSVVLSREPITGEDVYMKDDASILANGLTEFKIDNNQIVDKRRETAITPIYNALHGISFYPFEAHTEGLGWYEIGDNFDIINDTNDTFNTTLFNYNIVVDGGIQETLKTNAETKTQSQYEYATKTSKRLANAEITVNKQQNEITALVDATDEIQKEINPTQISSGLSIYLEDSAETELIDLELEGKTTQETRSGKNLSKFSLTTNSNGILFNENEVVLENPTSYKFNNDWNLKNNSDLSGKTYTVYTLTNGSISDGYANFVISKTGTDYAYLLRMENTTYNNSIKVATITLGANEVFTNARVEVNGTPTANLNIKVMVVEGSYTAETIGDYEPYGVMPSPDYPSELVSVGYKNFFQNGDTTTTNGITFTKNEDGSYNITGTATANANLYNYVDIADSNIIDGETYVLSVSKTLPAGVTVKFEGYNDTTYVRALVDIVSHSTVNNQNYHTVNLSGCNKVRFGISVSNGTTVDFTDLKISVNKGSIKKSYIPYGKYGVEVITTGKNLIRYPYSDLAGTYANVNIVDNGDGTLLVNGTGNGTGYFNLISNNIPLVLEPGTYTLSKELGIEMTISTATETLANISKNATSKTFTINETKEAKIFLAVRANTTYDNLLVKPQLEKGSQATTYEEYKSNTYLYTLDEPLRSIGDTKDLLYIKNGMLYVDRKIGKAILDGSESWAQWTNQTLTNTILCGTNIIDNISNVGFVGLSNYFVNSSSSIWDTDTVAMQINSSGANKIRIRINKTIATTSAELKTWLSTHNTEVQYVLATPYTEELGQVQMPSTYEGNTYINTTDASEPNMSITYVRDTLIANYVESHVRELKITEKGIESRVQTIEESDYGSRINSVEERTTDTEKNIEVISTNIDTTTGEVRKVTTTNGMTFDENGLNIHTNLSTFNAQHTYDGTYYRDGEEVITETTINGFKATNLKNKGQHEYSYDDTNDLYEFIDERIEVNGEYCYATFYNGEE